MGIFLSNFNSKSSVYLFGDILRQPTLDPNNSNREKAPTMSSAGVSMGGPKETCLLQGKVNKARKDRVWGSGMQWGLMGQLIRTCSFLRSADN